MDHVGNLVVDMIDSLTSESTKTKKYTETSIN